MGEINLDPCILPPPSVIFSMFKHTHHGQILGGFENVKITGKFFGTRVFELPKLSETAAIASVASAHVRTWICAAGKLLTPPE